MSTRHRKTLRPAIGALPSPFELKTLEGKSAGLETFRGKPLVINFFASWCDPCREEMPLINELASKGRRQLQVLGIAVEDTRAAVIRIRERGQTGLSRSHSI